MAKAQAVAEDPFAVLWLPTHSHRAGGGQVRPQFISQMEKEFADADDRIRRLFNRIATEARSLQADYQPIEDRYKQAEKNLKASRHGEHVEHFADEVVKYADIALAINDRLKELLIRTEALYNCYRGSKVLNKGDL